MRLVLLLALQPPSGRRRFAARAIASVGGGAYRREAHTPRGVLLYGGAVPPSPPPPLPWPPVDATDEKGVTDARWEAAHDLGGAAQVACEAVRVACETARATQAWAASREVSNKEDASPVTVADFAAQAAVLSRLRATFPEDGFVAEETAANLGPEAARLAADAAGVDSIDALKTAVDLGATGADATTGKRLTQYPRCWVLDPIDGTKGFIRGGQYCTALCLLVDGEPSVAVLGCPNLDLDDPEAIGFGALAVAVRGAGAFVWCFPTTAAFGTTTSRDHGMRKGAWRRLRVSDRRADSLYRKDNPLVLVEGVAKSHSNHEWARAAFDRVVKRRHATPGDAKNHDVREEEEGDGSANAGAFRVVCLDSQAKSLLVAAGVADAFIRLPTKGYVERVWDIAPAALLVAEAGGTYTDRRGHDLDLGRGVYLSADVDGVIATNGHLHADLVHALTETQALQESPHFSS